MSVTKGVFGNLPCGKEVNAYLMKNSNGVELNVLTLGLKVQSLKVLDKNGGLVDVVLGYDNLESYVGEDYQGSFVGRYANRIGGAKFDLDGVTYTLAKNNGENSLHGGINGFHNVVWDVKEINDSDEPSIVFTHLSPDGDEGYPGNLQMEIKYTLTNSNEVMFEYKACTDKTTPFNPTNHSYFNLSGNHDSLIFDTSMKINADKITVIGDDLIPTGEYMAVEGTALDFRKAKKIGDDFKSKEELMVLCRGYDHNFCVNGTGFRHFATASDPVSGVVMDVYSDMPGVQLYTFNFENDKIGKTGKQMEVNTAFCLETQFYPDSVNKPEFPFEFLTPDKEFYSKTVYKFS